MKKKIASIIVFIVIATVYGCATTDKKEVLPDDREESYEDTLPTARGGQLTFDPKLYVTKTYDANKDGRPDIINVLKKIHKKEGSKREFDLQLHVKMMDLNRDGNIDVWRFYDDKGAVVKEEVDLDFDGRIDVVNYYVGGVIRRKEFDVRFDERTDRWKHYDEEGVLILLEEDRNNNGSPDYWEHYTKGVLERIEKDTSGDGKPDMFQRSGDKSFTRIISTTDKFSDKAQAEEDVPEESDSEDID